MNYDVSKQAENIAVSTDNYITLWMDLITLNKRSQTLKSISTYLKYQIKQK